MQYLTFLKRKVHTKIHNKSALLTKEIIYLHTKPINGQKSPHKCPIYVRSVCPNVSSFMHAKKPEELLSYLRFVSKLMGLRWKNFEGESRGFLIDFGVCCCCHHDAWKAFESRRRRPKQRRTTTTVSSSTIASRVASAAYMRVFLEVSALRWVGLL